MGINYFVVSINITGKNSSNSTTNPLWGASAPVSYTHAPENDFRHHRNTCTTEITDSEVHAAPVEDDSSYGHMA